MKSVASNKHLNLFFLGFFGFIGIKNLTSDPLSCLYIVFFSNFAHIWWAKLEDYDDERIIMAKTKAGSISLYIGFALSIILSILIRLFSFDLLMLYRLQVLILAITFAFSVNLWGFLTYLLSRRYLR